MGGGWSHLRGAVARPLAPLARRIGDWLARYLSRERDIPVHPSTSPSELVEAALRPGDVLLVEGTSRFSSAIKYLTQSNWSHAALYVGDVIDPPGFVGPRRTLIEVDINAGVQAVAFGYYASYHNRICRPVGLRAHDVSRLCDFMISRLGYRYDLRNIIDLMRYVIQRPPVPEQWRRRMLELGSGDPTRAICSSLIAQAFQSIRYPILPDIERSSAASVDREIYRVRHHTLYTPRDFDVSPYFDIIKPRIAAGFDFRALTWAEDGAGARSGSGAP